jgi:AraC-like DNA-binding protein
MDNCPNLNFDIDDKVIGVLYLSVLKKVLRAEGYELKTKASGILDLQDPKKRVSLRQLLEALIYSLKDLPPGIGFKYSRYLNLVAADTLGQLVMSSDTIGQACDHLIKFRLLLGMSFDLKLEQKPLADAYIIHIEGLSHSLLPDYVKWFIAEVLFNSTLKQSEWLCGERLQYTALHFPFAPPPHLAEYESAFSCNLHFNSSIHRMQVPTRYFDFKILSANEEVMQHKYAVCTEALARWESKFSISQRLNALFEQSPDKLPGIDEVAHIMHTSKSCLYRRLQEEGSSYQCLVTEFKRKRSTYLLKHTQFTVSEIAEKLGFCDSSTFRRAFKGWTGMQPSCLRQQILENKSA